MYNVEIVGKAGCGKTTTLRNIQKALFPDVEIKVLSPGISLKIMKGGDYLLDEVPAASAEALRNLSPDFATVIFCSETSKGQLLVRSRGKDLDVSKYIP